MSKQANKTLIGGFVLGALALAVAGVLIFGSGRFFARTYPYVLYFDGSVKGLSIGAPVTFKGVKIGSVTDIKLRLEGEEMTPRIPVFIELEPGKISEARGVPGFQKAVEEKDVYGRVNMLVERGMRAQLGLQSIVTGQLVVEFDFHPDKPARLIGIDTEYPELPTISSGMQEIAERIKELPLDEILNELHLTLKGIEGVVNAPEVQESVANLHQTLEEVKQLVQTLNERAGPMGSQLEETIKDVQHMVRNVDDKVTALTSSFEDTSEAARSALRQAEKTLSLEEGPSSQLASSILDTSQSARDALDQASKTLAMVENMAGEDSQMYHELRDTLEEFAKAAQSMRVLLDYLERHPEALIKGKSGSGGK